MFPSLAALAKSKVAIAATAAALTAGGGVAAKAAITGDPNPFHWGNQVKEQVASCKDGLAPDEHGIGKCVSDFAKQNGPQVREAHSQAGSHGPADAADAADAAQGHAPAGVPTSPPAGPPGS